MYPRLIEIPLPFEIAGLEQITVYSYGFMLVVAVLTAAWLTGKELDRLYRNGRVGGVRMPVEGRKKRRKMEEVSPSHLVWTLATIAAVAGIVGSRLFYILENLDRFALDPLGMIFSSGGLTFYGGLIVAALSLIWYVRSHNLRVAPFADAMAPGLMLGYGIGRIGCYLAGDGDWGIPADLSAKPDWLPTWLWAETFPNNILGVEIEPPGVYPTMLYEFAAAALLAGLLWGLRKHPFKSGWLFSLYLVLNGVERFLIEKIRVNPEYELLGMTVTQAQVIAVLLIALGVAGLAYFTKRRDEHAKEQPVEAKATTPA